MSIRANTTTSTSRHQAGVSILEVLISLIVFTVGALAAVQQSLVARQQARVGEYVTEAAAAVQYQMEALRSLPYDSLGSGSDSVWGFPLTWTVSGTALKVLLVTVERPTVLGGLTVDTFVTYATPIVESSSP